MNIFHVLSRGKSRLHEPAISALLGYLLDSRADHGLGDSFLRAFLKLASDEAIAPILSPFLKMPFIANDVALEEPYRLHGERKDIDIQIDLFDKISDSQCRIIVENKIKAGAANPKQLSDYYDALLEDDPETTNLIVVFLTPDVTSSGLEAEFNALNVRVGHAKTWLKWDDQNGILTIIRAILEKEVRGEITPINEYMRHTLKAFVQHVEATVSVKKSTTPRFGEDIGEVVDELSLNMADGRLVLVVRRNSSQIQVFVDGEKTVAKTVLRELISEHELDVQKSGLDTRQMGQQVMVNLKKKGVCLL